MTRFLTWLRQALCAHEWHHDIGPETTTKRCLKCGKTETFRN